MEAGLQEQIDALNREIKQLKRRLARSRHAEASLWESERKYRMLFNSASIGLAQIAVDGRIIEANMPFCKLLGYSRGELLGQSWNALLHPGELAAGNELHRQVLAGELSSASRETRLLRKEGTSLWVNLNLSSTKHGGAHAPSVLLAAEDISERRSVQESLRRIASDLVRSKSLSPSGSWKWDLRSGKLVLSKTLRSLLQIPPSQHAISIDDALERIHPQDRPAVRDRIEAARAGKPGEIECRLRLPDGSQPTVVASGEAFRRDGRGRPLVILGLLQDVTSLRASEQRFRELFDNAGDGIFIIDRDGILQDVNQSGCRMLAYAPHELAGKPLLGLMAQSEAAHAARTCLRQDASQIEAAEWTLCRKDGSLLYAEVSERILPDGRRMVFAHDIGERLRTRTVLEKSAESIRDLYENAPCGYYSVDMGDTIVRINNTQLEWMGYSRDELVGKRRMAELQTPDSRARYLKGFARLVRSGVVRDLELEIVRKDGSIMPALMSASAVYDEQGRFAISRASLLDSSEAAQARKKLRQAAIVFEHTKDAIVITDAGGKIVAVNRAFSDITGYRPDEVLGKNPSVLQSGRQDAEFYRHMWEELATRGNWQGQIWDRRKSGDLFPTWQTITAVKDEFGKVSDYISVFSDITSIKQTEEQLLKLAYHDPLTGLPNRLLFNDRFGQALEYGKRHKTCVALLLLDLDRFKLINDTLGHAAGDQLLQVIARRLRRTMRSEDTVARLGGDEFAIVMHGIDSEDDAAALAGKVLQAVAQPVALGDQILNMSASVGISMFPQDATDKESLAKYADIAMYGAKDKGKNGFEFYTRDMTARANEVLSIDRGLRGALLHHQLEVLYQPQVDLAGDRIVSMEALLRWRHPQEGLRMPDRFIPVAEETSLIEEIGEWVFDTVCNQLRAWSEQGLPPIRVAINLSARELRRPGFARAVQHKLKGGGGFAGFGLDIEVTETTLQTGDQVAQALRELKAMGFRIAIDDFGTGYSSLHSLKHLPADILKIDRSFVRGIPHDHDDKAIASAIIAMGHSLGMSVLAEGIETVEQLAFLRERDCDAAQGFLFSVPLTALECSQLLRETEQGQCLAAARCAQARAAPRA